MVASPKNDTTTKRVDLFEYQGSQAIALPDDFRFLGGDVYATRDNKTGVISIAGLGTAPVDWRKDFLELLELVDPNDPEVQNYMTERPLNKQFKIRSVLDIADEDDETEVK